MRNLRWQAEVTGIYKRRMKEKFGNFYARYTKRLWLLQLL